MKSEGRSSRVQIDVSGKNAGMEKIKISAIYSACYTYAGFDAASTVFYLVFTRVLDVGILALFPVGWGEI